ncbi:MAG: hypothetical protein H7210_12585 [Pyrinomonadaceae bacterium]|nr:hypothetical protein [Phycisphaerales bacterium]
MNMRSVGRNRINRCVDTASANLARFTWMAPTSGLAAASFIASCCGCWAPTAAQGQQPVNPPPGAVTPAAPASASPAATPAEAAVLPVCTIDLALTGQMKDILANALIRSLKLPKRDVTLFLDGASDRYTNGQELLTATAVHFKIAQDILASKVEKFKHCNCSHGPLGPVHHAHLYFDPHVHPDCNIDLANAGNMKDIVSNTLILGLNIPQPDVGAFLHGAQDRYDDGQDLLAATAVHFKLSENLLAAEVKKFKHCNCKHGGVIDGVPEVLPGMQDDGLPVSKFAKDVTLHVVLHEIGHAVIREFDIPVLANEETTADAFATYYLTTYLPDRAVDVLVARTTSLMIEASESPSVDWRGEHDDDARRAYQIAALAVAADPVKYKPVADVVTMSARDIEKAQDYGGEVRRSWRRVLAPLWMPDGATSPMARTSFGDGSAFLIRLCEDGPGIKSELVRDIESALSRFDWHSQVTVDFVDSNGKAGWNRSRRTVTVYTGYIRRFIRQGSIEISPTSGLK